MEQNYSIVTENRGKNILDFSVNTNPIGVPSKIVQTGSDVIASMGFYPDPKCHILRERLGEKYEIPYESIYCGGGADDLLYRLVFALRPKKALILEPTFEEYSRALALVGCEVHHFELCKDQNFCVDTNTLLDALEEVDMVFVCNPNNPTGQLISHDNMVEILDKCDENNTVCVVDECFMEMLCDWRLHTVKQDSRSYRNLIVIDAFTKTYAIPGVRLGYAITQNRELLHSMQKCGQEFNVSTPAQWAGIMALSDTEYMKQTYVVVEQEHNWLVERFRELDILTYPSVANFFLVKSPVVNFNALLLEQGIKVRDCSKFYGLGNGYCRFAVRTHEENMKLIEVITRLKREQLWK
jgi:threonine-phosphate decarboxylase